MPAALSPSRSREAWCVRASETAMRLFVSIYIFSEFSVITSQLKLYRDLESLESVWNEHL